MQKAFFQLSKTRRKTRLSILDEKLDNFLTTGYQSSSFYLILQSTLLLAVFMHVHISDKLSNKLVNQPKNSLQNGIEGESQNADLMLFRHHFFQPGLLLRHHQEQMKLQQQQILSQWFQKEDRESQEILLKDGTCQWPGCEKSQFASKATFQHHLNSEHSLSQCSAAQVTLK